MALYSTVLGLALPCSLAGDWALLQLQAAPSSNHDLAVLGSASSKPVIDTGNLCLDSTPAVHFRFHGSLAAWPASHANPHGGDLRKLNTPAPRVRPHVTTLQARRLAGYPLCPRHTACAANGSLCWTLAAWSAPRDAAVLLFRRETHGRTPSQCIVLSASKPPLTDFGTPAISRSCPAAGHLIKTAENRRSCDHKSRRNMASLRRSGMAELLLDGLRGCSDLPVPSRQIPQDD